MSADSVREAPDADLEQYLTLVGHVPVFPERPQPTVALRVRDVLAARVLRVSLRLKSPREELHAARTQLTAKRSNALALPAFRRDAPLAVTHAPAFQLAAALRSLRTGFFGLEGMGGAAVNLVQDGDGAIELRVQLPRARPELATAIARGLVAFSLVTEASHIEVEELGLEGTTPLAPPHRALDAVPLPFQVNDTSGDGSGLRIEVNTMEPLSPAARTSLADLTDAYLRVLQLGLLPGVEGLHACAEVQDAATDTLPDQWTISIDDYRGAKTAINPLLEGLAQLHACVPIMSVELS